MKNELTQEAQWVLDAYRSEEGTPEERIKKVWMRIRKGELSADDRRLRADDPLFAIAANGVGRSFRAPIEEWMGVRIVGHFGGYCTKWPRTYRSIREEREAREKLVEWFEENTK